MKRLLLLLSIMIPISILPQQQDRFIIGAEHVSSFGDFTGQLPHSGDYWDTVKSIGINYAGLKYFQAYPKNPPYTLGYIPFEDIEEDLNLAASKDIDVYLTNGFDRNPATVEPYYPKRWLYQVENIGTVNVDFLTIVTGVDIRDDNINPILRALTHWDLSPDDPSDINFRRWRAGEDTYGIIVNNLREKNLQPDSLNYYLKVRMRLPFASNFPNTPVLTIRVKKDGGTTVSRTINANRFNDNNWKEIFFDLCFYKTANGPVDCLPTIDESTVYDFIDSLGTNQVPNYKIKAGVLNTEYDLEIEWHSTGLTVDIDYVAIDDETANRLYPPNAELDLRIEDFANNYKLHPAVKNFMVWDEPFRANLFPVKYYNDKVQIILNNAGQGNKTPLTYRAFFDEPQFVTNRFIHESNMQVLIAVVYPIPYYYPGINTLFVIPGGLNYTTDLQSRFQTHLVPFLVDLISYSKIFNKSFWFTVQAHKWAIPPDPNDPNDKGQMWHREPSAYEIKAMANLAVCYGARGLNYYIFTNNSDAGTDNRIGLLQNNNSNPLPRYNDAYGYFKWETVKQLNQKLGSIGDELLSLDWVAVKSWSDGSTTGNWTGLISNVTTNFPLETKYVETSHSTNQAIDYFFVVNRLTLPSDQRTINVTIDKASSVYNNWTAKEIGTSNKWTFSKTGNFQTSYEPGDGKLFKLQPTVMSGGDLLYNETISSDIELKGDLVIESGATLYVNADYYCYGNITLNGGTISGNGKIYFHNNKKIIVYGTSGIYGLHDVDRLELDFVEPNGPHDFFNGIEVKQDADCIVSKCIIRNARVGITINSNSDYFLAYQLQFYNCSESGINIYGPLSLPPNIMACQFNNLSCGLVAANLSEILVRGNQFVNNDIGINLINVTTPYIDYNSITSSKNTLPGIFLESCNGWIRNNTISGHTNAILLGNSSPDIGVNEITNNLYHGIYVGTGSLPQMNVRLFYDPPVYYPISGYNQIWENGGTTTGGPIDNDGSEIYFYNSNANLEKGCNSIYDDRAGGEHPPYNTRLLMNGTGFGLPISIKAEHNFWSDHPQYPLEERFGSLIVSYEPFFIEPCEVPGGGGEGEELFVKSSMGEIIDTLYPVQREVEYPSNTDLLYAVAEEKLISANYEGAETIYNQIINGDDSLEVKLPAYRRLYDIGKLSFKSESYFNNLNNVYTSLVQSTNDSLLINIFSQLGSLSLVGEEEYIQAIDKFDVIIQQNPGSEKAVYAEIDALTTALLIEEADSTLQKGRLGKYLIKSIADYNQKVDEILRKHFGSGEQETEEEIIPTEYTLYQNYPNPFNPVTTIKYDLPNTSEVSLIIYDILGRNVKELVNTKQQAGRYELQFNASNLSSGVYIYQLIAENFISSKKMILLK